MTSDHYSDIIFSVHLYAFITSIKYWPKVRFDFRNAPSVSLKCRRKRSWMWMRTLISSSSVRTWWMWSTPGPTGPPSHKYAKWQMCLKVLHPSEKNDQVSLYGFMCNICTSSSIYLYMYTTKSLGSLAYSKI